MDQKIREMNLRRFHRLSISVYDLDKCIKILEGLAGIIENSEVCDAALSFAVILYARPFTNNQKSRSKATPCVKDKDILRVLSPDEVELHHQLIELRNEALAHAEWDRYPTGISESGVILSRRFSIQAELQGSRLAVLPLVKKVHSQLDAERAVLYHALLPA